MTVFFVELESRPVSRALVARNTMHSDSMSYIRRADMSSTKPDYLGVHVQDQGKEGLGTIEFSSHVMTKTDLEEGKTAALQPRSMKLILYGMVEASWCTSVHLEFLGCHDYQAFVLERRKAVVRAEEARLAREADLQKLNDVKIQLKEAEGRQAR